MMSGSNSNQEENIIVKKIEGPSVDEEYQVIATEDNRYYEEEEPQKKSKIKVVLPIIALLVGGGAFYVMQNKDKLEENGKVVNSTVETTTKVSEATPIKKPIEEKLVMSKEEENHPVIVTKSEPKVEKKAPTHYIEALAMPTVVEKAKEIEKVAKSQIEKATPKKVENIVVVTEAEPQVREVVYEKIVQKKPKIKRVLVQKRKPTLVTHYEKIKPKIIHVRKGDTLLILAKRFYGNERDYKKIVRANRRIRSKKTTLRLGEKLIIPRKDNKTRRRYIIVEKGNTLAMIAKKFYGDERAISKIIRANHRIKSRRSMLRLGQKVYVPR